MLWCLRRPRTTGNAFGAAIISVFAIRGEHGIRPNAFGAAITSVLWIWWGVGSLEISRKRIWNSYYKRIADLSESWASQERIWSSYSKRIVDLMVLHTCGEQRKRVWSSYYKRISDPVVSDPAAGMHLE